MSKNIQILVPDQELLHYGIKGMRWGVRRTREQLGYEDKIVVKKGTMAQRITSNPHETNSGKTYISYKELDNLRYVAESQEGLNVWSAESPYGYKVKLKLTNDLVSPSYNERVDAFIKATLKDDAQKVGNEIYNANNLSKIMARENNKKAKEFVKGFQDKKVKITLDEAYADFSRSLMNSEHNRKIFFDELKNRGYNAVIDDNDAKGDWVEAPMIVFEREKNLKQVSYTKLTDKDVIDAQERAY